MNEMTLQSDCCDYKQSIVKKLMGPYIGQPDRKKVHSQESNP